MRLTRYPHILDSTIVLHVRMYRVARTHARRGPAPCTRRAPAPTGRGTRCALQERSVVRLAQLVGRIVQSRPGRRRAIPHMVKHTLLYFDFNFWRAEAPRLIMHVGGTSIPSRCLGWFCSRVRSSLVPCQKLHIAAVNLPYIAE